MNATLIRPDEAVSRTVYSAVWPETEALVRHCMVEEAESMLARHRSAHTKRQDPMHEEFFAAWETYAQPSVRLPSLAHHYPTAGSSEAIREIVRSALWQDQDLVVFDGDYEGYDAMALMQGTAIHRVNRKQWREQLAGWRNQGTPWGRQGRRAQWWVSQPSAIDGNRWLDFEAWLQAVASFAHDTVVWVDLCYLGVTTVPIHLDLDHPHVAGVVFSLSKTMGAYYRRIGGCLSRDALPGLWGNGWFKNLDSLYLGTRWLQCPVFQGDAWRHLLVARQHEAMTRALAIHRQDFEDAGVWWQPSDVALLMHADPSTRAQPPADAGRWWEGAARGEGPSGRRLCLTPSLTLEASDVAP